VYEEANAIINLGKDSVDTVKSSNNGIHEQELS